MEKSRGEKAVYNTFTELSYQIVAIICGLILPRLVLTRFGSTYNGIVHSILQFISCVELLKSGIGSVTRAALYKPLANNDSHQISEVVNATQKYMRKIALIFSAFIAIFSILYPFLVIDEISWSSAFFLVLILSISTFAQYFFGLTYQMLIQADQSNYIISLSQIFTSIANTIISAMLIFLGCSIHVVKLGSALVFALPPVFYMWYAKRKYNIRKDVPADMAIISQRWDAFAHQIANFINQNTDIMIATIALGVKEVSVYTVYKLVGYSVRKVISSVTSGVMSAFGSMLVKNEDGILNQRFSQFELLLFYLSTTLFVITSIIFVPFVMLYTDGVHDVNYFRPIFAMLVCIANYFACMKLPYEIVVFAAGKFKETKNAAFFESGLNIILSLSLVNVLGLNGLMIGTAVAGLYRMLIYNKYVSEKILKRNVFGILYKLLYSVVCVVISWGGLYWVNQAQINSFAVWSIYAVLVTVTVCFFSFIVLFIFFKKQAVGLLWYLVEVFIKGRNKK